MVCAEATGRLGTHPNGAAPSNLAQSPRLAGAPTGRRPRSSPPRIEHRPRRSRARCTAIAIVGRTSRRLFHPQSTRRPCRDHSPRTAHPTECRCPREPSTGAKGFGFAVDIGPDETDKALLNARSTLVCFAGRRARHAGPRSQRRRSRRRSGDGRINTGTSAGLRRETMYRSRPGPGLERVRADRCSDQREEHCRQHDGEQAGIGPGVQVGHALGEVCRASPRDHSRSDRSSPWYCTARALLDDGGVAYPAEAFDAHFDGFAVADVARWLAGVPDTAGRAGDDHVARSQRDDM